MFIVIDKSNTIYDDKQTMVQNYNFLFIRCPFCQEQFIYEMGLIYHIIYCHIAIQNNIKKRVRHSEVINALYYYYYAVYDYIIIFIYLYKIHFI